MEADDFSQDLSVFGPFSLARRRSVKANRPTPEAREKSRRIALSPTRPVPSRSVENQSVPPLTASQRRLLRLLRLGDLIWEIAEDPRHRTVYDEKIGRSRRLTAAAVTILEQQGWIQRRPNPQEDRLDSWELTPEGQALVRSLK